MDKVFRPAERSRLVYEILLRCPYRSPEPIPTGKFKYISLLKIQTKKKKFFLQNSQNFLDSMLVLLFNNCKYGVI